MDKKTFFIALLCALAVISLALNVSLVFMLVRTSQTYQNQQADKNILDFRDMFIEKVLLSGEEVSFDTRLSLETAVRNLNDPEIFSQWQKFANSQTQQDATNQARTLLSLLLQRTK